MKVGQFATSFAKIQLNPVTNPVKKQFGKVNLQGPDRDVFQKSTEVRQSGNVGKTQAVPKKEYTNEDALALMEEELKGSMDEMELKTYMTVVELTCKDLKIEPKNLPINEEHPGNLTKEQSEKLFQRVQTFAWGRLASALGANDKNASKE